VTRFEEADVEDLGVDFDEDGAERGGVEVKFGGDAGFELFFALSSFSMCSMRESKSARFGSREGCRGVETGRWAGVSNEAEGGVAKEVELAAEVEGTIFVFFSFAGPGKKAIRKQSTSAMVRGNTRDLYSPPRCFL